MRYQPLAEAMTSASSNSLKKSFTSKPSISGHPRAQYLPDADLPGPPLGSEQRQSEQPDKTDEDGNTRGDIHQSFHGLLPLVQLRNLLIE